jgi:dTDP-4-dehydrorhamnose reductase
VWLARTTKCKIIYPTTDCEFSGELPEHLCYSKDSVKDARDNYGLSKAMASEILEWFPNVKQIRTSIFGPELKNKVSIFEWFLSQTGEAKGYTNHFWNGITTLQWAKSALTIMNNWKSYDNVVQIGTAPIPKVKLLELINKVFEANKVIIPTEHIYCNKCLESDFKIKSLEEQLIDLKNYET